MSVFQSWDGNKLEEVCTEDLYTHNILQHLVGHIYASTNSLIFHCWMLVRMSECSLQLYRRMQQRE